MQGQYVLFGVRATSNKRRLSIVRSNYPPRFQSHQGLSTLNLKFFFDVEWVNTILAFKIIKSVKSYVELDRITQLFGSTIRRVKDFLNMRTLDEIVKKELRTNMSECKAKLLMRKIPFNNSYKWHWVDTERKSKRVH